MLNKIKRTKKEENERGFWAVFFLVQGGNVWDTCEGRILVVSRLGGPANTERKVTPVFCLLSIVILISVATEESKYVGMGEKVSRSVWPKPWLSLGLDSQVIVLVLSLRVGWPSIPVFLLPAQAKSDAAVKVKGCSAAQDTPGSGNLWENVHVLFRNS